MQVHITARHLDLTPALADYAQKKLERVEKHFSSVLRAQVILKVEKHRHIAEIVVHADGHHDFRAKEEAADLYAAVDLVAEKLHKHMARQKDKRVRRRRHAKSVSVSLAESPEAFPAAVSDGDDAEPSQPLPAARRLVPKSMTLSQAMSALGRSKENVLVFSNDDLIHVLYKKKDDSYGLLELNV
jgi:putative sigma-54 modulation protein